MAATTSAPGKAPARPAPSKGQPGAARGKPKGGARDKVSAGISVAQPELAPLLMGANKAHEKVFGSRHTLAAGSRNRVLMLEFVTCFVILGLGTIVAPTGSKDGVPRMMSRGTGLCLLFFILGLTASAGDGARRAANGLGGLVTVAYMVTSTDAHNLFTWVAGYFSQSGVAVTSAAAGGGAGAAAGAGAGASAAGTGVADLGTAAGAGAAVGGAAGAVAGAAE